MEMDRRYKILQKARVRNISTFNSRPEAANIPASADPFAPPAKLPYIVIVIDEMADLMLTVGKEIEESITRLAALSRAVGIHMIIATQRPSVNIITGTIKANFPGRISFKVAQRNDSRTILDGQGAEALIGHGDMLFLNPKNSRLLRAQGAWISEDEVHRLTEHCRAQAKPSFDVGLVHRMDKIQETKPEELLGLEDEEKPAAPSGATASGDDDDADGDEKTIRDAIQVLRDTRRASTSSLQRRLRLGYNRAARIMDMLEERGIVGPSRGADPREILIDLEGEIPAHISEVVNQNKSEDEDDFDGLDENGDGEDDEESDEEK
jgi:S-DNA-T family DNA segregation ATPase FtsK/SpoIIIE